MYYIRHAENTKVLFIYLFFDKICTYLTIHYTDYITLTSAISQNFSYITCNDILHYFFIPWRARFVHRVNRATVHNTIIKLYANKFAVKKKIPKRETRVHIFFQSKRHIRSYYVVLFKRKRNGTNGSRAVRIIYEGIIQYNSCEKMFNIINASNRYETCITWTIVYTL